MLLRYCLCYDKVLLKLFIYQVEEGVFKFSFASNTRKK